MESLTPDKIAELKSEYGSIFKASAGGNDFVFRPLKMGEFSKVISVDAAVTDKDEMIVSSCVVWTDCSSLDDLLPGHVQALSQNIVEFSGIGSIPEANEVLAETREKLGSSFVTLFIAYIIGAIPAYKPEDLDVLTLAELCELAILSETIYTIQTGIATGSEIPLQLLTPEEVTSAPSDEQHQQQQPDMDPIAAKLQEAMAQG